MINNVVHSIIAVWSRRKVKAASGGWITANAPCCVHRGESADKRGRGGLIVNTDGSVSFHCFNCGFSTRYQPGMQLSSNIQKLLSWMGADEAEVWRIKLEAMRYKEWMAEYAPEQLASIEKPEINFAAKSLPRDAMTLAQAAEMFARTGTNPPAGFERGVKYVIDRKVNFDKYNIQWSPSSPNRILIPFYWKRSLVGYTSRATNDATPKYISHHDAGMVFNIDAQHYDRKMVIVTEGPFDAMSIDAVAVLKSDVSETQIALLESLNREIVVVPDNTTSGKLMVNTALELGWSVSFPFWFEDKELDDVNTATIKYGAVFVMKSIIEGKESNETKIKLLRKNVG